MARLNDYLARLLLWRLKKPGTGVDPALAAQVADLTHRLEHLQATTAERVQKDQDRRKRHDDLKATHAGLKEELKRWKQLAWQHETRARLLTEKLLATEAASYRELERPGLPNSSTPEAERFLQVRHRAWKHPMRLGVLRQHEPRPLQPDTLPTAPPPGPSSEWPRISIVTPSYQQAAFLPRTLASVLDQGYPHLEYRVNDGGSTDGSVDILRAHGERLTQWQSEPDSGPASAINKGFAQTSGDIMAWINSDDVLLPGTLQYVAAYFARHPEVDAVYGHRIIIDERDHEVARWVLPHHDPVSTLWFDFIPQETLFWRRSLWEKAGGQLDESFKFAFDWELLLRFQKASARIVRLPYFLACFRVHDAQKSTVDIDTVGAAECARLRQRELGPAFSEDRLQQKVVLFQNRAVWTDRLLKWRVRW